MNLAFKKAGGVEGEWLSWLTTFGDEFENWMGSGGIWYALLMKLFENKYIKV